MSLKQKRILNLTDSDIEGMAGLAEEQKEEEKEEEPSEAKPDDPPPAEAKPDDPPPTEAKPEVPPTEAKAEVGESSVENYNPPPSQAPENMDKKVERLFSPDESSHHSNNNNNNNQHSNNNGPSRDNTQKQEGRGKELC